ncbi:Probable arabinose 5-phosphate isomerase [Dionaea muscipula]
MWARMIRCVTVFERERIGRKKPKMGSLASLPPISDMDLQPETNKRTVEETTLLNLFKSQQNYLNFFFQTLQFTKTLLNSSGTIFFTGVGKSGFVAQKISQTLISLGIKSGFLSPVDALHGDIGILTPEDAVVFFSKSGNTEELLRLAPCAKAKGAFC